MQFIITFIGSFLLKRFAKQTAIVIMVVANKVFLFGLLFAFVNIAFDIIYFGYQNYKAFMILISSASDGSSGASCSYVILASVLEALGFTFAFNLVGPSLFLAIFSLFNVFLLGIGLKIYRYIDRSITGLVSLIK